MRQSGVGEKNLGKITKSLGNTRRLLREQHITTKARPPLQRRNHLSLDTAQGGNPWGEVSRGEDRDTGKQAGHSLGAGKRLKAGQSPRNRKASPDLCSHFTEATNVMLVQSWGALSTKNVLWLVWSLPARANSCFLLCHAEREQPGLSHVWWNSGWCC